MDLLLYLPILYTLSILNIIINISFFALLYINNYHYERLFETVIERMSRPALVNENKENKEINKEDEELDEVFNYYFNRKSGVDEKKYSTRNPIPFNKLSGGYISYKDLKDKDEDNYTSEEKDKIIDSFSYMIGTKYSLVEKLAKEEGYKLVVKDFNDKSFYPYKGDTLLVELDKIDDRNLSNCIVISILDIGLNNINF